MKDYYTYLYGLPMKQEIPGPNWVNVGDKDLLRTKNIWAPQVTYSRKRSGKTHWYFYFDPLNPPITPWKSLSIFTTDESKQLRGSIYSTFSGEEIHKHDTLKMPKTSGVVFITHDQKDQTI